MNPTKTLTILSLLATLASATTYENANNDTTDKWKVYDNKPAGAIIENIYDKTLNSKVIKLVGEGRKNAYMLGHKSGKKAWNNRSEKNISWKMNFSENFKIMVYVKTSLGQRVLYYDYKNKDRGVYKKKYIRFGLGRASKKGTWLTIQRDLEADLEKYEPNNSIVSVNAFRVNGSGMVDDIELTKTKKRTTTTKTSNSKVLRVSSVQSKKLSNTIVQIAWNLNQKGTGQVEYGVTQNYGSFSKKDSSFNYDAHAQKLKHLKANTTYHYRVISEDKSGHRVVSNDATFSTKVGNVQTKPKTTNTNLPITLKKLKAMIKNGEDVTQVNTSEITDMSKLFSGNYSFNQDISRWDVSNVTNMQSIFYGATNFNENIENWDVSNVKNMKKMFFYAKNFNQSLKKWDVSNVKNMSYMFAQTTKFNQPIEEWNTVNVTNMEGMFNTTRAFNHPIENWNVSNVKNMKKMFCSAINFNQPIEKWNVSKVTNMTDMFSYAVDFDQDISQFNISKVSKFGNKFLSNSGLSTSNYDKLLLKWSRLPLKNKLYLGAKGIKYSTNATKARQHLIDTFNWTVADSGKESSTSTKFSNVNNNSPITRQQLKKMIDNNEDVTQVNTSAITNMSYLFAGDSLVHNEFNQDISRWDVSNVTNMSHMFSYATKFNQPIGKWNVSNVTNMSHMFSNATEFNQPIDKWNVSNVTNMLGIFQVAINFNQPIGSWDISKITKMNRMFFYAKSFNQPLEKWNVSNVTNMEQMFEGARSFNHPIEKWDVSNVTAMRFIFKGARSFNQPIEKWDVSNVTNMRNMFQDAKKFNQPIGKWDISKITSMWRMFQNASNFNQPLGEWNVSNVTNMQSMFQDASNFNQPLGEWNVSKVINMNHIFFYARNFNQPIGKWDVSTVKQMDNMFNNAKNFNQDISHWNISNVETIQDKWAYPSFGFFTNTKLSTTNYDKLLIAWSKLPLKHKLTLNVETIKYSHKAAKARQTLIEKFNWTINDGGEI